VIQCGKLVIIAVELTMLCGYVERAGGVVNQLIIGMVGKTTVLSAAKGELQVEIYDHKAFIPTNMGV
jgi:hypothetical protein